MRWIVFALGLGLVIGGLAAMSEGYAIVQIERGWTLVIAGTVALGTGVIALALGIVITRIETLIAVFAASRSFGEELSSEPEKEEPSLSMPAEEEEKVVPPALISDDEIEAELSAALAPIASASVSAPPAPAPVPPAEAVAEPPPAAETSAESPPERVSLFKSPEFKNADIHRLRSREIDEGVARRPPFVAPAVSGVVRERPRATFVRPPPAPPEKPVVPTPVTKFPEPEPIAKFPEPAPPEPAPAPALPALPTKTTEAADTSEYDWLELALAGIDSETALPAKAEGTKEGEAFAEPATAPAVESPLERKSSDNAREPIPLRSAEPAASTAIVGRYESNGASYALFADGTIEAATPSGVYRFASMTELKEFIENNE